MVGSIARNRSTAAPLPGAAVRGSTSGRPLMAALDLLGRRWALRVLWELRDGPLGFRALQAACDGMSSSVLRDRLRELSAAALVQRGGDESYALTALGVELGTALSPLSRWAERWGEQLAP
jgi:DNA-binding HxlR family transcriptional regulator